MNRKNKILSVFILSLVTCLFLTNLQISYAAQQSTNSITILLNGEKLSFDVEPYIKEGRTLVPFRGILEALGAEVIWNPDEKSVTTKSKAAEIYLKIGSTETLVNGSKVIIDVAAEITNSRTFVPLRFVSENLGATVLWDGATRTVSIDYKDTSLVVDPGTGEVPSAGAVGVFDNGDIRIVIDKVEFDSTQKKFHIYGKANFSGETVFLRVYDSTGSVKMADYVSIGNEKSMKNFEAVVETRTTNYNPESIFISIHNEEKDKLDTIGKIVL